MHMGPSNTVANSAWTIPYLEVAPERASWQMKEKLYNTTRKKNITISRNPYLGVHVKHAGYVPLLAIVWLLLSFLIWKSFSRWSHLTPKYHKFQIHALCI